jgi:EAL domain-containing protein (putative c-di-GMP-specific phosphodiesterase class I)
MAHEFESLTRILVIDDEPTLRRNVARALAAGGHVIVEAGDGEEGLAALATGPFDAILSDIEMPNMSGIDLLRSVRSRDLDVPIVFLTSWPAADPAAEALRLGAVAYLMKPTELAIVRETVERAIRLGQLARIKRAAIVETAGAPAGPGDRAGLEFTFARAMQTLWPAFQPLVRVDGSLYGHEALLRSTDPELAGPAAVLDAAERLGRLNDVGRRMRGLAAAAIAGRDPNELLFVNLHPLDLFDDELFAETSPLLAVASRVVLEITERASLEGLGDVKARAAALRARGFRLAIDDLGAGYAGLTAFVALEPEVAKLDMSLIRDVDKSATKQKLVRAMAALCRDLGILIIAEGVETPEELQTVIALGCDVIQGYLLARPGPAFPSITWPAGVLPSPPVVAS